MGKTIEIAFRRKSLIALLEGVFGFYWAIFGLIDHSIQPITVFPGFK
jgi:hypothetical protein